MHRPGLRCLRRLGRLWPVEEQQPVLHRHPATVDRPGRPATPLSLCVRPSGRRPTRRRGGRVPGVDRPVHVADRPARAQRRAVPGHLGTRSGPVRAGHHRAAGPVGRSPGTGLGGCPGTGVLRLPELGPAGDRGVRRGGLVLGARTVHPHRGLARGGYRAEALPGAVRAAPGGRPTVRRGPTRRRAGGPGQRGHLPGHQPAVPGAESGRLVGHLPVPEHARTRHHHQLNLVLGFPEPGRRCGQPPQRHPGRVGLGGRVGPRLVAGPARRRLPVDPGVRRDAVRVPAVQQGALTAVHPVAAAVLRVGPGALGLVVGLSGVRRAPVRRPVPVVPRHRRRQRRVRPRPGSPGDRAGSVGAGRPAGDAVRGVPAFPVGVVGAPPRRPACRSAVRTGRFTGYHSTRPRRRPRRRLVRVI